MKIVIIGLLSALLVAGCGSGKTGGDVPPDAKKLADTLTGDAKGAAADNPQCKLFTQDDAAKYLGKHVGPGKNAAMGSGCQWSADDGESSVMVQVVPARYHSPPSLADGFKDRPDLGEKGFVAPDAPGFQAGAIIGKDALIVSSGSKNPDDTVALFKAAAARLKR